MQDKARPSLDLANEQTTMENEKAPVTEQPRNPFGDSAAPSVRADSYYSQRSDANRPAPKRRFESYRLRGDYEKPWATDKRLRRTRCGNYIIWGFIAAGLALSAFINFNTARKVPKHPVGQKFALSTSFASDAHLHLVLPGARRSVFHAKRRRVESRGSGRSIPFSPLRQPSFAEGQN